MIKGISASKGYAIGKIFVLKEEEIVVNSAKITDIEAEKSKFETAKAKTAEQIGKLYEKAVVEVGEEHAEIFNVHMMMLEDLDYTDNILSLIENEHQSAAFAVNETAIAFSQMFSSMEDEYMKARSADVLDISNRLMRNILGIETVNFNDSPEPMIVVAEDLYPSDTLALDKAKVLAFVTEKGSKNSHTAILARTLGIPSIVDLPEILNQVKMNDFAIVDGDKGEILLNPSDDTVTEFKAKILAEKERQEKLKALIDVPSYTKDGVHVETCANIGNLADLDAVLENGAEGIGLFRSEFIYMNSKDFPTEDDQFEIYKEVLARMDGKRVIIRTLDLGADKKAPYFDIPDEENPAMGYRAIRICLNERHIFRAQLRALLRASMFGKLAIMFPMIISEAEIVEIKAYIEELKAELRAEGISFANDFEIGIMIETPAAAIMSDALAKHVDFFSVGTNDLTQYTLAVDRMNSKIADLYDYANPAVMRLMKITVDNAHKHGVWVGICGESGGNTALTETYIAMGIDELSCSAKSILEVREKVLASNAEELRKIYSF